MNKITILLCVLACISLIQAADPLNACAYIDGRIPSTNKYLNDAIKAVQLNNATDAQIKIYNDFIQSIYQEVQGKLPDGVTIVDIKANVKRRKRDGSGVIEYKGTCK